MLRRDDGAEVVARVSPYPLLLHQLLANQQWDKATKLCYAIKVVQPLTWAQTSAIAVDGTLCTFLAMQVYAHSRLVQLKDASHMLLQLHMQSVSSKQK